MVFTIVARASNFTVFIRIILCGMVVFFIGMTRNRIGFRQSLACITFFSVLTVICMDAHN
ncbi:hypothetical protein VI01_04795 [Pantoea sp. SM3]|nr:hypothetical protein VI01_04795 [Pantoea sp. SM3]